VFLSNEGMRAKRVEEIDKPAKREKVKERSTKREK